MMTQTTEKEEQEQKGKKNNARKQPAQQVSKRVLDAIADLRKSFETSYAKIEHVFKIARQDGMADDVTAWLIKQELGDMIPKTTLYTYLGKVAPNRKRQRGPKPKAKKTPKTALNDDKNVIEDEDKDMWILSDPRMYLRKDREHYTRQTLYDVIDMLYEENQKLRKTLQEARPGGSN